MTLTEQVTITWLFILTIMNKADGMVKLTGQMKNMLLMQGHTLLNGLLKKMAIQLEVMTVPG